MANTFNVSDARDLLLSYRSLIRGLEQHTNLQENQIALIKQATDRFLTSETLKVLRSVPVDELNRNKEGFRMGALKDAGYLTVADILAAGIYNLASIRGISEDTAWVLKQKAKTLQSETLKTVRPRLSQDSKDELSSALVVALAAYLNSKAPVYNIKRLLSFEPERRAQSVEALRPVTGGLTWFFSSREKKERAEIAYYNLQRLVDGKFGKAAELTLLKVEAAANPTVSEAWDYFGRNSAQFFVTLEEIVPGVFGNGDALYGLPEDLAREIQDQDFFPDGLNVDLYQYQVWGVKYILHQERVLLGDEMGLGKTIQSIAAMVSLRNTGETHFMVICPASVISNWTREISKHSKLRPIQIYGSSRRLALNQWKKVGGVAVTNYETTDYIDLPADFHIGLLTVDEAHYIKNPNAKRSMNVRQICTHAERLLFMTGTALENKVDEMITLIDVLQPQIARRVRGLAFMASAPEFREKVAPVYYRRKKEDVLDQLPDKVEKEEWCRLGPQEEHIYETAVLNRKYAESRRVSWSVDNLNYSSKARRMMEIVEEAANDNGRKILVFTFFLDTASKCSALLGDRCVGLINGSVNPTVRQKIIDDFEAAPGGSALVCQIQSGGTGLNIQAASVVIICEPQLKPSIENQAIARAYRMGQSRTVFVHRLLCENTVDEKIMDMLEEKQRIFDEFADKSVAADASPQEAVIDNTTMNKIINEEIARIQAKNGISASDAVDNDK